MKARHIITPLLGALIVLAALCLASCSPKTPDGGLAVLNATRPAAPVPPTTRALAADIERTATAITGADREAAVLRSQTKRQASTIAELRAVLANDAAPLQQRLAEAEKYAEQLEKEITAMSASQSRLDAQLADSREAIAAAAENERLLVTAIEKQTAALTAMNTWADAATDYAAAEKEAREEFQKDAAKYKSFHDARWSRWLKWGGILTALVFTLTSAGWIALILYLRSNPTALAARIAGGTLSNY